MCGGERYTEGECAKGFYVRPTVFDNCTSDMTIVREEIFGPVVTIQTFKTEQEAIDMANDTEYGLAGAVFTADGSRALRVIKEIRAGITWINCYNPAFNEAPWGGYKKSGIGRDLGVQGLEEYQEIKQINIIKFLAEKETCIIVGRCADFTLEEMENAMHIYIYAPYEVRVEHCVKDLNIEVEEARKMIVAVDEARDSYHMQYAGYHPDDKNHKSILVDSSFLGVEGTADFLVDAVKRKFQL